MQNKKWALDGGRWPALALRDDPDTIFNRHLEDLRAGAEVLLTASHRVSLQNSMKSGMYLREARENIFSAVMLACMAREKYLAELCASHLPLREISIGGTIGPTPMNEEFSVYYEPKIEALLSPRKNFRTDFLAFECIPNAEECRYILSFIKRFPGARISMTFLNRDELAKSLSLLRQDFQVFAWGIQRGEDLEFSVD